MRISLYVLCTHRCKNQKAQRKRAFSFHKFAFVGVPFKVVCPSLLKFSYVFVCTRNIAGATILRGQNFSVTSLLGGGAVGA